MPESKATLPFPYNDNYVYGLRTNAERMYSNSPFFIWKVENRNWTVLGASDSRPGVFVDIVGSRWFNHAVDTSDLGDNYTKIREYTKDYGDFLECNYPVYEVVYDENEQKFNVVRE